MRYYTGQSGTVQPSECSQKTKEVPAVLLPDVLSNDRSETAKFAVSEEVNQNKKIADSSGFLDIKGESDTSACMYKEKTLTLSDTELLPLSYEKVRSLRTSSPENYMSVEQAEELVSTFYFGLQLAVPLNSFLTIMFSRFDRKHKSPEEIASEINSILRKVMNDKGAPWNAVTVYENTSGGGRGLHCHIALHIAPGMFNAILRRLATHYGREIKRLAKRAGLRRHFRETDFALYLRIAEMHQQSREKAIRAERKLREFSQRHPSTHPHYSELKNEAQRARRSEAELSLPFFFSGEHKHDRALTTEHFHSPKVMLDRFLPYMLKSLDPSTEIVSSITGKPIQLPDNPQSIDRIPKKRINITRSLAPKARKEAEFTLAADAFVLALDSRSREQKQRQDVAKILSCFVRPALVLKRGNGALVRPLASKTSFKNVARSSRIRVRRWQRVHPARRQTVHRSSRMRRRCWLHAVILRPNLRTKTRLIIPKTGSLNAR